MVPGVVCLGIIISFCCGGAKMSAVLRRSNARTESATARLTRKAELVITTTRNISLSLSILIISTVAVIVVEDVWGYLNATLFVLFNCIFFQNSITVVMLFLIRYIGKSRAIDSEAMKSPSIRNRTFGGMNSVAPSVMSTNGGT